MDKPKNDTAVRDISISITQRETPAGGYALHIALSLRAIVIAAILFVFGAAVVVLANTQFSVVVAVNPTSAVVPNDAASNQTFSVDAAQGWQNIGITVQPGDNIIVQYVSGQWRIEPSAAWDGADGGAHSCNFSDCVEPVRGYSKSGLVGRIGDGEAFIVGSYANITAQTAGPLQLRINDIGTYDNAGSIMVRIRQQSAT